MIARLTTENACLRELLNISTHNEPNVIREFTERSASTSATRSNGVILNNECNSHEGISASFFFSFLCTVVFFFLFDESVPPLVRK